MAALALRFALAGGLVFGPVRIRAAGAADAAGEYENNEYEQLSFEELYRLAVAQMPEASAQKARSTSVFGRVSSGVRRFLAGDNHNRPEKPSLDQTEQEPGTLPFDDMVRRGMNLMRTTWAAEKEAKMLMKNSMVSI